MGGKMPSTLEIRPSTVSLQISRGGKHTETLRLTKLGGPIAGYAGELEPKYPDWVTIKPDNLSLRLPDIPSKEVELTITVPQDAEYGPKDWKMKFVADINPTDVASVDIHVDVPKPSLPKYWWVVVAIFIVAIVIVVALALLGVLPTK